jgi:hypothetical protein
MAYRLKDGFSVNTGYFSVSPSIRGVFNSPAERFDRAKHSISFDFKQGGLVRKGLGDVEVQITGIAKPTNIIARFYDLASETENEFVTAGGQFVIDGARIKIAGEHPDCGLYFLFGEQQAKLETKRLAVNSPSKIVGAVPALAAAQGDEIRIAVKTQFGGSNKQLLKEPRTVEFDRILTAA